MNIQAEAIDFNALSATDLVKFLNRERSPFPEQLIGWIRIDYLRLVIQYGLCPIPFGVAPANYLSAVVDWQRRTLYEPGGAAINETLRHQLEWGLTATRPPFSSLKLGNHTINGFANSQTAVPSIVEVTGDDYTDGGELEEEYDPDAMDVDP